jgi:predicted dehydrogenase
MKFLIAGFGSIGRRHLRNLRALGQVDIALYRTHKSTLADDEIKGLPVYTDLQEALAQQPDGVIISNPTALHLEVAIPAAKAGCHIFIEKPVAHNLDRVDELEDALLAGGGKVVTGFQFRFHPTLQKIRSLLQEGEIGRPLSARAHWGEYLPGWHPWEDYRQSYSARADLGGGVVLTLCHPLDYLRWFLGEVQSVWGFTGEQGDLELDVEDTAELGLRFYSGLIASVHLDYWQRPSTHHLEISGTGGMIQWNQATGAARLFRVETDGWESFLPPTGFDRNDMFMAETRHFLAVMRGEEQPICTLNDGVQALRLALAACQAGSTGTVISLDHAPLV